MYSISSSALFANIPRSRNVSWENRIFLTFTIMIKSSGFWASCLFRSSLYHIFLSVFVTFVWVFIFSRWFNLQLRLSCWQALARITNSRDHVRVWAAKLSLSCWVSYVTSVLCQRFCSQQHLIVTFRLNNSKLYCFKMWGKWEYNLYNS